jgi:hypothetical protein
MQRPSDMWWRVVHPPITDHFSLSSEQRFGGRTDRSE